MVGAPASAVRALAFVSAALGSMQFLTLMLSAMRVPVVAPVAAGIVAVSLVVGAGFAQRFARGEGPGPVGWLAIAMAGTLWLLLLVVAWMRPVYDWDGLYYHLPAIHGWCEAGRVAWIHDSPDVPFVNGYPMAVEVLGFLTARIAGHMRLVDAGNLWFWPQGFLGLVLAARAVGARGGWAWAAGLTLFSSPMFLAQSITAYVDPAFACAVIGTMGVLPWALRNPASWSWTILLGLQLGLMVGAKGLGVPFVVVATVLWVSLRTWDRLPLGSTLAHLAGAAGVALAIAGFWFVRNVVEVGNPIHPIRLAFFGRIWFDGYDHAAATLQNLPPWLIELREPMRTLKAWTQPAAPIRDAGAIGGLGFVWLAGLVASIGLALRDRTREWALLSLLMAGFLWAQPATWWARFTLWLLGIGGAGLGAALARWPRPLAVAAGGILLATATMEGAIVLRAEIARGRTESGWVSAADYYFRGLDDEVGEVLASAHLGRSDWSRLGTLLGGVLAQDPDRRIEWLPRYPEPAQVQALVEAGVDWIVWDVSAAGEPPLPLLDVALERRRFAPGPDATWEFVRVR